MRTLLFSLAMVVFMLTTAQASPENDALRVLERWTTAFVKHDVESITKLYAPTAVFIGTNSKGIVSAPAGVRKYFEDAFKRT